MTNDSSTIHEEVVGSGPFHRQTDLIERTRRRLATCRPCAYYLQDVRLEYRSGRVTVNGRVPTDALRSLLESTLSRIDGVEEIDNRVNVISSTGLSRVYGT